ncbi:MazG nucleotide pyrophosphohydrolase domain-containing protein, partial [Escherichia coli]
MNQIDRLLTIMQRLRDPENGCPWDKEQTFATIAPYTLEETYEVLDAIAREDFDDLRGELGDLLFQVVFYAQMAQEEGRFDFNDICAAISDKLELSLIHISEPTRHLRIAYALLNWSTTSRRKTSTRISTGGSRKIRKSG